SAGSARAARAATRTRAERRRDARRLRRKVARLSSCLDDLATDQRRVLILRSGYGSADPHSRRRVARILDVRPRKVRRLERRALREAGQLRRAGACRGSAGATAPIITPGGGGGGTDTGAVAVPGGGGDAGDSGGAKSDTGSGGGTTGGSGDVRGESDTRLAPPSLGDGGEPGGVSLAIGIALIVLALAAGFATPHLRGRLRSS
ncbi:MAG TPA: hypothetical protein VFM58_14540, partial [Solirubrobacteraceae bacterium]|nr:hypothetical protein [Solirubrobacteraceae bacterium]